MIARLQRLFVFGWLLAAVAWVVLWWERSPGLAVAGVCALALGHAAVLAAECIIGYGVNAHDTVPRALPRQWLRAWVAECLVAPRVFCWQQPFRAQAVPDQLPPADGRRGAVLVHGIVCNRGFWNPWLRALRADGRAFVAVDLEPLFCSIDDYVARIDAAIEAVAAATGWPPVLICHSMGGLAARAWLRTADGARVHRIVTIGTPHAGAWLARFGRSVNGRQMRVGSEWLSRIEPEQDSARQVPFTCWYSDCDNIVFPASTAMLPGADNRLCRGRAHVEMAFDAALRRDTLALLEG